MEAFAIANPVVCIKLTSSGVTQTYCCFHVIIILPYLLNIELQLPSPIGSIAIVNLLGHKFRVNDSATHVDLCM